MEMVRSKDAPRKASKLPVAEHIVTTMYINIRERRNIHVLGFSRLMALAALFAHWQVLLDRTSGPADWGLGTPV